MYVYNIHTYQTSLNLNIKRVCFHVLSLTKCNFFKGTCCCAFLTKLQADTTVLHSWSIVL